MILYEGVHPLEGGALRLKFRRDRRHGMPMREPVRVLSALCRRDRCQGSGAIGGSIGASRRILDEVLAAPDRWTYSDLAIAPPQADEFEALDLYHATSGGEAALARKRRDDAIRAGTHATAQRAPAISAAE